MIVARSIALTFPPLHIDNSQHRRCQCHGRWRRRRRYRPCFASVPIAATVMSVIITRAISTGPTHRRTGGRRGSARGTILTTVTQRSRRRQSTTAVLDCLLLHAGWHFAHALSGSTLIPCGKCDGATCDLCSCSCTFVCKVTNFAEVKQDVSGGHAYGQANIFDFDDPPTMIVAIGGSFHQRTELLDVVRVTIAVLQCNGNDAIMNKSSPFKLKSCNHGNFTSCWEAQKELLCPSSVPNLDAAAALFHMAREVLYAANIAPLPPLTNATVMNQFFTFWLGHVSFVERGTGAQTIAPRTHKCGSMTTADCGIL